MKRMMIIFFAAVLMAAGVSAQVPQTMSYQGVLKDAGGVTVPDDDYSFEFRLYISETEHSYVWTETQVIHVTSGLLNATLGAVNPIGLAFNRQYWLGISIDGGTELAPRTLLTGAPYALNAQQLRGGSNLVPSSGDVGLGTTSPSSNLHIYEDIDAAVGITIENPNIGGNSTLRLSFEDENGSVAGLLLKDDDAYWSQQMSLFNNRPGGNIHIGTMTGSIVLADTGNVGLSQWIPQEKLDVNGAIKVGNTANTNEGAIRYTGTDFEGYVGSAWHSLTSGSGSSLPSGSSGQTLRHNGADWVANSHIYNDGTRVGIGTVSPAADLEVVGENILNHFMLTASAGAGPCIRFNAVNKDWGILASNPAAAVGDQKLVFRDMSTAQNHMVINAAGYVGIGTEDPTSDLHVEGWIQSGSPSSNGNIRLFAVGSDDPLAMLHPNNVGGNLTLYDESHNITSDIKADESGTGGILQVYSDIGTVGFDVNGNWGGYGVPRIFINGTSSAAFVTDEVGNASVSLPGDAVSSFEILNEPGATSATSSGSYALDGTIQTLLSSTINAPTAGYVLVIGTVEGYVAHTNGLISQANFGVSDSPTAFPPNQDVDHYISPASPSMTCRFPVSVHGLFSVAEGANTFYLLAEEENGSYTVADMQLTAVFLPTAYGTVTPTLATSGDDDRPVQGSSLSSGDIAAERRDSEAANARRIENELATLRAEIEQLKRDMREERPNKQ